MEVLSVNVGMPKDIAAGGQVVRSGIFKYPVTGVVRVHTLNLDGDGQADLTVHGGRDKAVYVYPSEHYPFWRRELDMTLPDWGAFGENLTVEGMSEDTVHVGDQIAIGSALLQVTQPRLPCFKLAAKFQRDDIIERFLASRRTGFYVRVLTEGSLQAGDAITVREQEPHHITIREITDLYANKHPHRAEILRVLSVDTLSAPWRKHFEKML
jgi:MOSC domain-containing protein YiiM